jgi:Phosphoesterase family
MARAASSPRVVVFLQENKTPDFSFRSMAAFGADIAEYEAARVLSAAPDYDQPHDRNAWVHFRIGDYAAVRTQLDNDKIQPLHAWLAKNFTFCDHHFAIGSNSTSGHLLTIGGQTPTLKNPPFGPGGPTWDMPSIFVHAERNGLTWAAVPDADGYPTKFYDELNTAARKQNIHPTSSATDDAFVKLVEAGNLPQLTYAWAPNGADEHPPFRGSDPDYLNRAHDLLWRRIDAVVNAGLWANTVFILAYDDWGGYADHVVTPVIETAVDALHPEGFALIGGSRLPLVIFGGKVRKVIDNSWHSNASIPKTILDLLGLPKFGLPRVDTAPSLAGFVDTTLRRPKPPAFGARIIQPKPPTTRPKPVPTPPWIGRLNRPLSAVILNGGKSLAAPKDAVVRAAPPTPPKQAPS